MITHDPEKAKRLLEMLEAALNKQNERLATHQRETNNLEEQIILLCNEFLAATGTKHSIVDVILALAGALGTSIAQHRPDAPSVALDDLEMLTKVIRARILQDIMVLHCQTHHGNEKHKEPKA